MARIVYKELSKAKIKDTRNMVISIAQEVEHSGGKDKVKEAGYVMTEQIVAEETGGRKLRMFMKPSHQIENLDGLRALRNALNIAICDEVERLEKVEEKQIENI